MQKLRKEQHQQYLVTGCGEERWKGNSRAKAQILVWVTELMIEVGRCRPEGENHMFNYEHIEFQLPEIQEGCSVSSCIYRSRTQERGRCVLLTWIVYVKGSHNSSTCTNIHIPKRGKRERGLRRNCQGDRKKTEKDLYHGKRDIKEF